MRATICLPTYNELENLEAMLRALAGVLREGDRVLVIDDASPDGTGELADRLAAELPFVGVLHRTAKEGLGPAYMAGFERALADGAELVLEMDCDFSHDPAAVPRLIAAAEAGADLVLGSRYVPGGTIPNWSLTRRAISLGGNLYAQIVLQSRLRDLTGGFKCFRAPRSRDDRPEGNRVAGLRVPDRDDLSRRSCRLPDRRGADLVLRPRARPLEDEQVDRRGGDLEGAAPADPGSRRPPVTWRDARDHRRELRAGCPACRQAGRGRLLGSLVRPLPRDHPVLEQLAGETDKVEFVKVDIDENPVTASRYDVLSIPTVLLFESGVVKETVIGARPAAHFRQAFQQYL